MDFGAYQHLLIFVILVPLFGASLSYVFGQRNQAISGWISTSAAFISFLLVVILSLSLGTEDAFEQRLASWLSISDLQVAYLFRFDTLTSVMCLVITGVGSLIHLYSIGYMAEDPHRPRYFACLNLFLFFMLLLVLGGNMLILFAGWEGVGLCSYLLIGFWHKNPQFASAGRKAFIVNRIGDAGFLAGIFLIYQNFGTFDFSALSALIQSQPDLVELYSLIGIFLFIGACGKSAQIPLFVWLPDAMAGPTPVSALIHAATMVTAGIYMMARLNFLYTLSPFSLAIVALIALATALMAATIALAQNDIKKVLAYSTISQLGFMFLGCAAGAYSIAIFHLVTHSFFKACLFLCAGSVIHCCHHEQDMRKLGGLYKQMPTTGICYAIASLAIAGVAPFSGYYSKHAIISAISSTSNPFLLSLPPLIGALTNFIAFLTAIYMARSFAMVFLGSKQISSPIHDCPWTMRSVLIILAGLSAIGGIVLVSVLPIVDYLSFVTPSAVQHGDSSIFSAITSSWIGISGVAIGLFIFTRPQTVSVFTAKAIHPFQVLFQRKWYVDELYEALIVNPTLKLASFSAKSIDSWLIDGTVKELGRAVISFGEVLRRTQTGQVRHYGSLMLLALLIVSAYYMMY